MTRTHERTAARRCAAQILYSGAIRNRSAADLLRAGGIDCIEGVIPDYSIRLIEGIEDVKSDLDSRIDSISQNWSVSRMPIMDLAVLRLALYEMLYVDEVPISVSINEAVEMAKAFGGDDDSPRFINGMLGNIARQMEVDSAGSGDASVDVASDAVDALDAPSVASSTGAAPDASGVVADATPAVAVDEMEAPSASTEPIEGDADSAEQPSERLSVPVEGDAL